MLVYKYLARSIKTHIIKEGQFFFTITMLIGKVVIYLMIAAKVKKFCQTASIDLVDFDIFKTETAHNWHILDGVPDTPIMDGGGGQKTPV